MVLARTPRTPPPSDPESLTPSGTPIVSGPQAPFTVARDMRSYLPPILSRFLGYRVPLSSPPYDPLPFPPFTWLARLPMKYEVWITSVIGSFVGIALLEIVNATAFADKGIVLIVASFGASAVLCFGTIDSPLAQPRHVVGGQIICAIVGVGLTRLFRLAGAYQLDETTMTGELSRVVWLNGATAMALALLAMQITGTVHPPAGATALIASVQPAAVHMSWHFVYIVIISSFLMLGWACIINNVGRRRYPQYWLSGQRVFVHQPDGTDAEIHVDQLTMAAVEGRNDGFAVMQRALSIEATQAGPHSNEKHFDLHYSPSRQHAMELHRALSRQEYQQHLELSRSRSRSRSTLADPRHSPVSMLHDLTRTLSRRSHETNEGTTMHTHTHSSSSEPHHSPTYLSRSFSRGSRESQPHDPRHSPSAARERHGVEITSLPPLSPVISGDTPGWKRV